MSQRSSCRPLVSAWATGPAPPRGLGDDGIHLAYRLRRPLGSGRGYAAAVARSAGAVHFQTLTTIRCEEVGAESRERPALVRDRAGRWRLYLSCATPGTRHWRVELMEAGHPEGAAPMLRRLIMLTAPTAGMSIATVLTLATPALATGPSQARITDPGLVHAIVVPGDGEPGQQGRLATLAGQTSLFTVLFGAGGSVPPPAPLRTPPPTASLGPRYTIIYTVPGVTPQPGEQFGRIRQDLYPHAAGGPVIYTPPGQRGFGQALQATGWLRGSPPLARTLAQLGVPPRPGTPAAQQTHLPPPRHPAAAHQAGSRTPGWLIASAIAAAALAGTVLRPRHHRPATGHHSQPETSGSAQAGAGHPAARSMAAAQGGLSAPTANTDRTGR